MKKRIAVLGATGSVGTQTMDVARALKDHVEIVCISAHHNWRLAAQMVNEFHVPYVVVAGEPEAQNIKPEIPENVQVLYGQNAAVRAVEESGAGWVMLASTGISGITVFDYCLQHNITVALANKETVVCGGELTQGLMDRSRTKVIPVDSEHAALYQCLHDSYDTSRVKRLIITASGGPFFGKSRKELQSVCVEDALRHPNWSMGQKITIDSATLANKGLEVIEAHYLYRVPQERISVLVHPQSIVHSMVEFQDSSILAQMGPVDMRLPIQKAMLEEEMLPYPFGEGVDLAKIAQLSFYHADMQTFSALALAYQALQAGGSMPAVFSFANDAAVRLFLQRRITFLQIPELIAWALDTFAGAVCRSVDEILDMNKMIAKRAEEQYC